METFKRRFSIDAPTPIFTKRRQSEPVLLKSDMVMHKWPAGSIPDRRYSTSVNSPIATLHGCAESEVEKHNKYSSNREVRKLSLSLALQEAVAQQYGFTPIFGLPIVYTAPPDELYTSTCYITLSSSTNKAK